MLWQLTKCKYRLHKTHEKSLYTALRQFTLRFLAMAKTTQCNYHFLLPRQTKTQWNHHFFSHGKKQMICPGMPILRSTAQSNEGEMDGKAASKSKKKVPKDSVWVGLGEK